MQYVFLLFVLAWPGFSQELLGRWRPVETSKGGIGAMLEFQERGVLLVRTGAVVESPYSVEGQELLLPSPTVGGPAVRQVIDLRESGVLRLWQGQKLVAEFRRVGNPIPDPAGLAGEWVGQRDMGGRMLTMRMIFDGQGKQLFLMPFRSDRGTYRLHAGKIEIQWPNGRRSSGAFAQDSSSLTLPPWPGGTALRYLRY